MCRIKTNIYTNSGPLAPPGLQAVPDQILKALFLQKNYKGGNIENTNQKAGHWGLLVARRKDKLRPVTLGQGG